MNNKRQKSVFGCLNTTQNCDYTFFKFPNNIERNAPAGGESSSEEKARETAMRSRRLMKELKKIHQHQETDPTFDVELVDDSLYEWHVRLYKIDKNSKLADDMRQLKIPHILLHLKFPENYPFAPPFMRVIEPYILGGYVQNGGAICMDLLTPSGWASIYTAEGVVIQFAVLVASNGRIDTKPAKQLNYSLINAEKR